MLNKRYAARRKAAAVADADRTVLLFFELTEVDKWIRGDRLIRRVIKDRYRRLTGRRRVLGVQRAFLQLVAALERAGYHVQINDRRSALDHPRHPIGLCGWPHVLHCWDLPNPAILGPGLFDHPGQAPKLMEDPRYSRYMVNSPWTFDLFRPYYGDTLFQWFAGVDTEAWPDTRDHPKSIDVLIYAKFLWDPPAMRRTMLAPVVDALERRGMTWQVLHYGSHNHEQYRDLLNRARALIFLCEHETQGIAVQEAMSCGLPVLAWDAGWWLDPVRLNYGPADVPASSVPYFSPECGERFSGVGDFEPALDRFLASQAAYDPRRFVIDTLSMDRSARIYADEYFGLLPAPSEGRRPVPRSSRQTQAINERRRRPCPCSADRSSPASADPRNHV
ncbi:MAG: glycosyltransferase [Rhodospirillales bacterium]|nr:glycosyltransferase [Rhodospirillales bacterium]